MTGEELKERTLYKERILLAKERLLEIEKEEGDSSFALFFREQTAFCLRMLSVLEQLPLQGNIRKLREVNKSMYEDILPENYETSFCNPAYAVKKLGVFGQLFSMAAAELKALIPAVYEKREEEICIRLELLLELYSFYAGYQSEGILPDADERTSTKALLELKDILYYYVFDYIELISDRRVRTQVDPREDFAAKIIREADLSGPEYLYAYGEYVTEEEEKMAAYMANLPEETVKLMADTFTEGYRMGFELAGKDLSKKKTVNVRYALGFERMMRYALLNFEKMGLAPTIYRHAYSVLEGKGVAKIGYFGASANRQMDYDHKEDMALVLDKRMVSRRLDMLQNAYENNKEWAFVHAGPAVQEIFGEEDFKPSNKPENPAYDQKMQLLQVEYAAKAGELVNRYIKGDERSFTIIAFPVPAIGNNFAKVFDEIIRINTLDYMVYRDVQQKLIDALDLGEYVVVKGMGANHTNMKVNLYKLTDPAKQTIFENCVADVNIPVGEVFTSPVLSGTEGTLHVTKVFLNELQYDDLELQFKDGKIVSYSCRNFASEEENKKLLKDQVLFHHDTLPIGEFAIGTNTTAYVAAKRLGIADKLPILIAEKMGPHFAVGDTCYSHTEDLAVYNPDGKEIVARDNEVSILRKTDPQNAYLNCHTDITIPYDELGEISVVCKDNTVIPIIEEGRFVLPGCEILNVPFAEG